MIEIAIEAIKIAGGLLKDNFCNVIDLSLKSQKDFITKLDLDSEREIIKVIKSNYPGHNIISEEVGFVDNNSEYAWIIDPLCSTNNFIFGLFLYGIAIAILFRNEPLLGAIYLPELNYLLTAEKGKGAFLNDKKIYVSRRERIKDALILYDNQFYRDKRMYENLLKIIEEAFTVRILGSAAFDLSLVAMGKADARIFHRTKPFDFVAGGLIVEEAGGKVTNFKGEKFSIEDSSIVASNGSIHNQILEVLDENKKR